VSNNGFGFFVAFTTSLNLMVATVGYIMKNKQTPIGIDKFPIFRESKNRPNSGKNFPNSKPMIMQVAIHRVRYFSNMPKGILLFNSPISLWCLFILKNLNL